MESSSNHFLSQEGDQGGLTWENVYDMNTESKNLKNCIYALNSLLLKTGFLSLGTTDLWARHSLLWGCPVYLRVFCSIPGLYPPNAMAPSPLLLLQYQQSFQFPKVPWGGSREQNQPQRRATGLK